MTKNSYDNHLVDNHSVLYRKYRPKSFKDVIGQDHVVRPIENSIKLSNVAHAYLFAGSRGTGKTSVARIFAEVLGTTLADLYEMDAASNRGIDDIREIREGVNTLPFESKYKVYIIDEVHMLTKEAFNALLKTLEEPPPHAIFILATTEIEKLPETIVSRCQTFVFKKPNQAMLRDAIVATAKKEGFALEPSAGDLLAALADGSFRDAHGILQKVISASSDKKISRTEVEVVTGAPRSALVNDFVSALSTGDLGKGIASIRDATDNNIDIGIFLRLILEKVRFVLILANAPDMANMIKERVSEADFEFLSELAKSKSRGLSLDSVQELLQAGRQIGHAYIAELPLELALMRIVGQDNQG